MAEPTPEELRRFIADGLDCEHVEVEGDGRHFFATIVSREFEGTNRIARHQRVYRALGDRMQVPFKSGMIGGFDAQLAHEFFQGFANHALVTLHIDNLRGENAHHQCETVFKAFARALRMAVAIDPRLGDVVPSTKGSL